MVKSVVTSSCRAFILTASILDPCGALLVLRSVGSHFNGSGRADHWERRQGNSQLPPIHRWSVAPEDKVISPALLTEEANEARQNRGSEGIGAENDRGVWMLPSESKQNPIFLNGRNILEEENALSSHAEKQGAAAVAKMDLAFKAAFEDRLQVPEDTSPSLKQLQNGACQAVVWGKKEVVKKQQNRTGVSKGLNLFASCPGAKFTVSSGGQVNTWRECANKVSGDISFFSWLRKNAAVGECTLLGTKDSSFTEDDIFNCLKDAKPGEVAVTGYGPDPLCTSCLVSEWTTTACSAWCEAGVSGHYRTITTHVNLDYCHDGTDESCDKCPHLWKTSPCNQGVKCGSAIQPGKHYCPEVKNKDSANTETWQECSQACLNSFNSSGGNAKDPTTFSDASCFRYSYHNTTSTCELKPLAECDNSLTTADPLWISGDVLTMPDAGYSTVIWTEWANWSSCEGIDTKQGWKKRRREITSWGFRNDGLAAEKQVAELGSCADSGGPPGSSASTQGMSGNCCLFGDFVEWTETECDPVCGSDRYAIRKKRRLQNPVLDLHEKADPICNIDKCKLEGESAESRKCDDVHQCTSDCVYLEWTEWSHCACSNTKSESGTHTRVRKAVSGTICPDMEEQGQCTESTCKEEDNTMTYIYAASGGVIGLLLIGGLCAYRRLNSPQQEASLYETL